VNLKKRTGDMMDVAAAEDEAAKVKAAKDA
jgi:hypothetical protein